MSKYHFLPPLFVRAEQRLWELDRKPFVTFIRSTLAAATEVQGACRIPALILYLLKTGQVHAMFRLNGLVVP